MSIKTINVMAILQVLVALLLLTFGIDALTAHNSAGQEFVRSVNRAFGGNNNIVPLIIAVLEIVVGALLLMEFFVPVATKFVFIGMVIICIVWIISIIMPFFMNRFLDPNFISWLRDLSVELVLLTCFWLVGSSKQ
jgi:uncharacterized membrane protein YphA (DoxX/SURF4 family)